ncbi:ABZJ_00895 family protein [Erythrobacter sp. EC-HK427]|uniref:ABZJ_00895 family protein n=1 Tax=Erythrobacter sp. EC-HK427 TaxID=2038396 RepID=UPI001250E0FC|nr:ABZJ_00895 family protein [Erythrobacter sp. EC-HK427]VVS99734.1 membrane hypothetical protein [Erythrobacter sp. EC-HK427]
MIRYVGAYFLLRLIVLGSVFAASFVTDAIPDLTWLGVLAASAGAMYWFGRRENRRLSSSEIWRFAIGTGLAELALTSGYSFALLVDAGLPISIEGLAILLGEGSSRISNQAFAFIMLSLAIVTTTLVTLGSALIAWLMTKNLVNQ